MTVNVKFIGALRHGSGADELAIDCAEGASVRELISKLTREFPELKQSLVDSQFEDSRTNALILVNGREISALDGLKTKLEDGDKVVLVPVVHGG